jgi:protein-glucosylgalactosylhydroxylysine glucosidase
MFPPIALINHQWAKRLLYYRFIMIDSAKEIAKKNGYKGAQYPWESAAIGFETVQPGYEYIAKYQIHNTGDISFAMQQYFGLTRDGEWACEEGLEMAEEIAKFWASRVTFNESTGFYDINHVMGPDEDHRNVSNNVYTNVVAAKALQFGA